jgi:hypothetical protein
MSQSHKKQKLPVKSYSGWKYARESADFLLGEIENDPEKEYLIPSFIICLCLGIESVINDAFIDFFHRKMGKDYKDCVKPFIYMRLDEKLSALIPLVSNYEYQLNKDHTDLKKLLALVEFRNHLTHVKHHWHSATVIRDATGIIDVVLDNPRSIDFYSGFHEKEITLAELKDYKELFNKIEDDFRDLGGRYGRRGKFEQNGSKHGGWFKKVKRR